MNLFDRISEWWFAITHGLQRCVIKEFKRELNMPIDVTEFLSEQSVSETLRLIDDPIFNGSPALLCKWVTDHIHYRPEVSSVVIGDFWKMASETIIDGAGDCEDGAILLANMMLAAGGKSWKIFVAVFAEPRHVAVVYDGRLYDWTRPDLRFVPKDWVCSYMFNSRNSYTTKERVALWKK